MNSRISKPRAILEALAAMAALFAASAITSIIARIIFHA